MNDAATTGTETGQRVLRPEIFRIAGTLLAAIVVVIGLIFDLGTRFFLVAVVIYGLSTALYGLVIVRNWRGMGTIHRRVGSVSYNGWAQLLTGTIMIAGAIAAFIATA